LEYEDPKYLPKEVPSFILNELITKSFLVGPQFLEKKIFDLSKLILCPEYSEKFFNTSMIA